jgi:hypothetical protein
MLKLETREQSDKTGVFPTGGDGVMLLTPPVGGDYWKYRVMLSADQAIIGFPKFGTIGIGFAKEEDWNTNLPSACSTEKIWEHIKHNKGDDNIKDEDCIAAIKMIQDAVGDQVVMVKVVVDSGYVYAWNGDEELRPGDLVLLPENKYSLMENGPGPFVGVVKQIGSNYKGELKEIIRKLPNPPEEKT